MAYFADRRNSIQHRHFQIYQRDMWLERANALDQHRAVACLAYNSKIWLGSKHRNQAITNNRVIVGHKNRNWLAVVRVLVLHKSC